MTTAVGSREWLSVGEFVQRNPHVGGRNFVYEQCRQGKLTSVKIGGKVLVASDALDQLAERRSSRAEDE